MADLTPGLAGDLRALVDADEAIDRYIRQKRPGRKVCHQLRRLQRLFRRAVVQLVPSRHLPFFMLARLVIEHRAEIEQLLAPVLPELPDLPKSRV